MICISYLYGYADALAGLGLWWMETCDDIVEYVVLVYMSYSLSRLN